MIHTIARVDRASLIVDNLEHADDDWIATHSKDPVYQFVVIDDQPDVIRGWIFDPVNGTFSPPAENV